MKKINPLLQLWVGTNLPKEHIFISQTDRPQGLLGLIRIYFRKWFIHPVKRKIAKYYLFLLKNLFGLKVIAITGSAGKTTTKDMVASILRQKASTVVSFANIDPVYNIPTTILNCRPSTKYLVLEMGIEYPGEMDFYLWMAKPDISVITNIFPTHTLFFGNEEGVAREKGKIVKFLGKNGIAVLNNENKFTKAVGDKLKSKIIWFGKSGDIEASKIKITKDFSTEFEIKTKNTSYNVEIPILGQQFVSNALAAASVAEALGFSQEEIIKGLKKYSRPEHRMNVIKLENGGLLLDDSYNNNPAAAKESLGVFKSIVGKRKSILVFGDMLELGVNEISYHREIGKLIGTYKFDYVIGVGKLSRFVVDEVKKKSKKVSWVSSQDQVLPILKPIIDRNSIILVKGSRSIGLDKVVSQLS